VDIHIDIQAEISMQGHSAIDILGIQISTNGYPCFMVISLHSFMLLWISMHEIALDSRFRAIRNKKCDLQKRSSALV